MKYNNPSSFTAALPHSKQSYPTGYRFHPTHQELIIHLKRKMLGLGHDESVISEVHFCKFEPWELAKMFNMPSKDNVWYFFCLTDLKYKNMKSSLRNRTTAAGYWKPTGKLIPVKSKSTKKQIGTRRTLVFYKGRSKSKERTGWIAHEFELFPDSNLEIKGDYTLFKLKKKSDEKACKGALDDHHMALSSNSEGEPSDCMTYDYQYTTVMTADSTCNASEPSHLAFDNEIQSSSPSTTNSACDENKQKHPTDFDLGGQDSTEMVVSSACNDGEPYCNLHPALENHDPNLSPASYNELMDYDPENQISLSDFETSIPVFIIGSPYDKGEPCSRKASDFGNQNQDNNNDISCCIEGDQISPAAGTPPNKENDISILDENSSSLENSLLAEDSEAAAWLAKVSPELVTEMEAEYYKTMIGTESEFNFINQSSCTPKEAPSAMAMDPFVSSGCLLWNSVI